MTERHHLRISKKIGRWHVTEIIPTKEPRREVYYLYGSDSWEGAMMFARSIARARLRGI